jgi:hypothetical protein
MSLFKHWLKSVKYEWHHTKNLCCQTNSVYDVQFWKWCWIIHNCDTSFEFYKKSKMYDYHVDAAAYDCDVAA